MKTNLNLALICCFILIGSSRLGSQNIGEFNYALFLTPKISIPELSEQQEGDVRSKTGVNIVAIASQQVTNRVQLGAGIKYTWDRIENRDYSPVASCDISANLRVDRFNSWFEDRINIHYIGMPVEIKYVFIDNIRRVYFKIGGEYLFKIKENHAVIFNECGQNEFDFSLIRPSEVRDFTMKMNVGVGIEIASKANHKWIVEPEIGYSLSEIYEQQGRISNLTNTIKLLDIGLRMGVSF